jgi:hypothetical protein
MRGITTRRKFEQMGCPSYPCKWNSSSPMLWGRLEKKRKSRGKMLPLNLKKQRAGA